LAYNHKEKTEKQGQELFGSTLAAHFLMTLKDGK